MYAIDLSHALLFLLLPAVMAGIYIKGRVGNELRELVKEKGSLTVEDVYHVTTMHYLGEEPIDNFESILRGLSTPLSEVRVLEIGSGFAGDARVLASRTGCKISCVEIQEHISEQAEALSSQLKLSHLVRIDNNWAPRSLAMYTLVIGCRTIGAGWLVSWWLDCSY